MSGTRSVLGTQQVWVTTSKMTISEWDCGTVQPCNGTLSHMEHCRIWYWQDKLCEPHWWCYSALQVCMHKSVHVGGWYCMCVHVRTCEWVIPLFLIMTGIMWYRTVMHVRYTQCHVPLHNSLQFSSWGQIQTGPQGTSSLGGYHPKLPSEGMSNHPYPPRTSSLQRGATGTSHTPEIHHRQQGEGQWVNPVYMVSVVSGMLYWVVGTTAESDSLVPYEEHLLHVLQASSGQGHDPSLQQTSLESLTKGENNQMVFSNHKTLHVYSILHV